MAARSSQTSYSITVTEPELFLILQALQLKVERTDHLPDRNKEYQTLHDRLELVFEERN